MPTSRSNRQREETLKKLCACLPMIDVAIKDAEAAERLDTARDALLIALETIRDHMIKALPTDVSDTN